MAAQGEWVEFLRSLSPGLGNPLLAYQREIHNPWDRDRLKIKLEPEEQARKAMGFQPLRESLERDKTKIIKYSEEKRRAEEQRAIDEYIEAVESGDSERIKATGDRAKALKITFTRIKEEMDKKKGLPVERTTENVPKKRRGDYRSIENF